MAVGETDYRIGSLPLICLFSELIVFGKALAGPAVGTTYRTRSSNVWIKS